MRSSTLSSLLLSSAFVIMIGVGQVHAGDLLTYLPASTVLDDSQQRYLDEALSWPMSGNHALCTVDFSVLGGEQLVINRWDGLTIPSVLINGRSRTDASRRSWVGEIPGAAGNVHVVYRLAEKELVAHVQWEDIALLVRPLGGGIHAVIDWDMSMDEGCLTHQENSLGSGENKSDLMNYIDSSNPDALVSMNEESESNSLRTTGECNIRVLVAYTNATASAVVDILSDVINMTNISNTGYNNSNLAYSIEVAAVYNIAYTESGDLEVDRDRFRSTSDGFMDDIHTQRLLWDADQCMLLTSTGSGIAFISTAFADQFAVTGVPNFNAFTYHHELGHCNECTHATNQLANSAGVAPYAGWGDPATPNSCFRTVMAYKEACGDNACPRQNIFSDNDANSWTCGGNQYTPGTTNARNQDRLVLSRSTIIGHNTVGISALYSSDYDWLNNESIHFAAHSSVGYSSPTNNFELRNGSEGSFRATDQVILGEGFWARSGTDFRAYLEDCP